jgi:DNA repair protein RecN (Recombination protein N)
MNRPYDIDRDEIAQTARSSNGLTERCRMQLHSASLFPFPARSIAAAPLPRPGWLARAVPYIIASHCPIAPQAMLLALTIRDVVLIDRLSLAFRPGLCVLTGETGAGKSILLDALGLALGRRADPSLVRPGADQASVAAEFVVDADHPGAALLRDAGIAADLAGTIVVRRVVHADGRSRAFVNDEPASVGLLRALGESLVEIQGQGEQRGLLDPATHRALLDGFGEHDISPAALAAMWRQWRAARDSAAEAARLLAESRAEEDLLRHHCAELDALAPEEDEEERLGARRALLQNAERLGEAVAEALTEIDGDGGAQQALSRALRRLERARDRAQGLFDGALAAAERAAAETAEALEALSQAGQALELDPRALEEVEERLFTLRGLARKHSVAVADLPRLRAAFAERLRAIDSGAEGVAALEAAERAARAAYIEAAGSISRGRELAAGRLDAAIAAELKPLRLDKARFRTVRTPLAETDWGEHGMERVQFEVATNPGAPFGPLARIASGGELSRFMLALKLVLSGTSSVPTLIFDEVDSGIGGAVAAAVGERLQRLGTRLQVLVVTHSPQVAARGAHHWRVAKRQAERATVTRVEELDADTRQEEIARMLSGSTVTAEARAAAASLIAGART